MAGNNWWENEPWRMVQTNLREIDMEDMDAEAFAEELADYHATVVNLNAAGILASYETALPYHKKSAYLHGDSLQQIIEACHRRNIRVIARCDFSKIAEDLAQEHPDWVYRDPEGRMKSYDGFVQTCLNGPYQQKYIFEILEELFNTHDFDGIFCNMSSIITMGYDYELLVPCHCETCTKLFREETGMEIPDRIDPKNPAFMRYMGFQGKRSAMQKEKMARLLRSIRPGIAINGVDFKRSEVNQDVGRQTRVYDGSTGARKNRGVDGKVVSDNASVDFLGFRYRHSSVSSPVMELRQWQNLANTGSLSLYIMGTLGKHRDQSSIRASRKAFDFMAAHEDIFRGLKSAAKVLLLDKQQMGREDPEVAGFIRALTECHIPFDEAPISALNSEQLGRYEAVILPDVRNISDAQAEMLDSFVAQGGRLIGSGCTGVFTERGAARQEIAVKAFGLSEVREIRKAMRSAVFEMMPEDEALLPSCTALGLGLIVPGEELIIPEKLSGTEAFMRLIPEQPAGPPEICYTKEVTDIPGLYRSTFGKGCAVYVPFAAGSLYRREGYENTFTFLKDVLLAAAGIRPLAPELTPMCEVTVMEKAQMKLIQLVNTSGCFLESFFEPLPISNIRIDADVQGKKVYALNGGNCLVRTADGRSEIILDRLEHYEAIVIEG